MKTNSKAVKEAVKKHIIECLQGSCSVADGYAPDDDTKGQLEYFVAEFKNWYNPCERQRDKILHNAFRSFLQGLPSCFSYPFTYFEIRQVVRSWLQQTKEDADKYDDEEVCSLYFYLLYREFLAVCKKNKVDFISKVL